MRRFGVFLAGAVLGALVAVASTLSAWFLPMPEVLPDRAFLVPRVALFGLLMGLAFGGSEAWRLRHSAGAFLLGSLLAAAGVIAAVLLAGSVVLGPLAQGHGGIAEQLMFGAFAMAGFQVAMGALLGGILALRRCAKADHDEPVRFPPEVRAILGAGLGAGAGYLLFQAGLSLGWLSPDASIACRFAGTLIGVILGLCLVPRAAEEPVEAAEPGTSTPLPPA